MRNKEILRRIDDLGGFLVGMNGDNYVYDIACRFKELHLTIGDDETTLIVTLWEDVEADKDTGIVKISGKTMTGEVVQKQFLMAIPVGYGLGEVFS